MVFLFNAASSPYFDETFIPSVSNSLGNQIKFIYAVSLYFNDSFSKAFIPSSPYLLPISPIMLGLKILNYSLPLLTLGDQKIGAIFLNAAATPFMHLEAIRGTQGESPAVLRQTGIYLTEDGKAGTLQQIRPAGLVRLHHGELPISGHWPSPYRSFTTSVWGQPVAAASTPHPARSSPWQGCGTRLMYPPARLFLRTIAML